MTLRTARIIMAASGFSAGAIVAAVCHLTLGRGILVGLVGAVLGVALTIERGDREQP